MTKRTGFLVLLAFASATGAFYAWVDARPGWDDTGVMMGLVLVTAAICGCAAPRRPWVWALAVGAWIPAATIARSGDAAALLALAAAAAGAYGGSGVRRLLDGVAA